MRNKLALSLFLLCFVSSTNLVPLIHEQEWSITELLSIESDYNSHSPSLDVDQNGMVHVAYIEFMAIYYQKNIPGIGWTSYEQVSDNIMDNRAPSLSLDDDGTAYVAWQHQIPSVWSAPTIKYIKDESGKGWGIEETIGESGESCNDWEYSWASPPSLYVGYDGTIHIAYPIACAKILNYIKPSRIIYISFTPTGGWSHPINITTESVGESTAPSLGVGVDGSIHIAWVDETSYAGSGSDSDIFYKKFHLNSLIETRLFIKTKEDHTNTELE